MRKFYFFSIAWVFGLLITRIIRSYIKMGCFVDSLVGEMIQSTPETALDLRLFKKAKEQPDDSLECFPALEQP